MADRSARARLLALGLGAGAVAARQLASSPPVRFARMSGSTIATPAASAWVTDFLNAAFYQQRGAARNLDNLRLAFAILTTRWHGMSRRLAAHDVWPFHAAFFAHRWSSGRPDSPRGTLNREQLLDGASRLFGPWFPDAYTDPDRRGWGIVFESATGREVYRPEVRLGNAVLGPLTPPVAPGREQIWHTYPPVAVDSAEAVIAALSDPATWPDYASAIGRFTPLRSGGLEGQTFEIEVMGQPTGRTPVFLRAYVTITRLVSTADHTALADYHRELDDGMARFGRDEPPPLPAGAEPLLAFDLTTHENHFMGAARNRLLLFRHDGQAYLRAAGTWDPLEWHLEQVYSRAGRYAQHAFWGMESAEESMLHQIATAVALPGE